MAVPAKREHLHDSSLRALVARVRDDSEPIKPKEVAHCIAEMAAAASLAAVDDIVRAVGERLGHPCPRSRDTVQEHQELALTAWKLMSLESVQNSDAAEDLVAICGAVAQHPQQNSLVIARCAKAVGTALGAGVPSPALKSSSLDVLTGLLVSPTAANCGRHGCALALALALPGLSPKATKAVSAAHATAVAGSRMTKPLSQALAKLGDAL